MSVERNTPEAVRTLGDRPDVPSARPPGGYVTAHGRRERRSLDFPIPLPDALTRSGVRHLARFHREREPLCRAVVPGKTGENRLRHHLAEPEERVACGHGPDPWAPGVVDNPNHPLRDCAVGEDSCLARTGNGPPPRSGQRPRPCGGLLLLPGRRVCRGPRRDPGPLPAPSRRRTAGRLYPGAPAHNPNARAGNRRSLRPRTEAESDCGPNRPVSASGRYVPVAETPDHPSRSDTHPTREFFAVRHVARISAAREPPAHGPLCYRSVDQCRPRGGGGMAYCGIGIQHAQPGFHRADRADFASVGAL